MCVQGISEWQVKNDATKIKKWKKAVFANNGKDENDSFPSYNYQNCIRELVDDAVRGCSKGLLI